MCIAGVFGGLESGVTAKTTAMFLESAYFDAGYIRKTAKKHTLSTDASFRFERGADPEICVFALKRAAMLIKELAGGEISSEIIDVYPQPIKPVQVKLAYKRINSLIGEEVPVTLVKSILKSLDIIITSETAEELNVIVPLYRSDVTRDVDIIEDILRIYGYNTVKVAEKVNSTLSYAPKPDSEKLKNLVSDLLVSRGSNEAMSNSLTKGSYYDGLQQHSASSSAKILNPLSNDLNVLRQTLFFGLMEAVKRNKNYKTGNIRLFEFGNCYSYKTGAA
ncbi:MAG TPA: phenylalanine--tRNA ligase subunit beta, partial [Bacteroidales bacterium]|nr:phenylalanine--tRNA ligase subunit beta [Bacteroidales bacterium]